MEFGLVSIIMAAYNAEKTIEYAIQSVLAQTYPNYELIVIDDCSTDKTANIVKQISYTDNRIVFLSNEKNLGVSQTRKRGLECAKGNWVAILDSDDAWLPSKLEKQILLQQCSGADLLYTGSSFMDEQGNLLNCKLHVPYKITYKMLLKQNLISNSSAMVRKEIYKQNYVIGDKIHEDFAVWLKILKKGYVACGVDEQLLIYRLAKKSKSGNKLESAKMNWKTYRFCGLGFLAALYYEIWYTYNGIVKYHRIFNCGKIK